MRYLADTHIALWLIAEPSRLSQKALAMMENPENEWFLSAASVWEVALKHAKHPVAIPLTAREFHDDCIRSGLKDLPVTLAHIYQAGALSVEGVHGDPFDRMILAQARHDGLMLVTHDSAFSQYDDEHVLLV